MLNLFQHPAAKGLRVKPAMTEIKSAMTEGARNDGGQARDDAHVMLNLFQHPAAKGLRVKPAMTEIKPAMTEGARNDGRCPQ